MKTLSKARKILSAFIGVASLVYIIYREILSLSFSSSELTALLVLIALPAALMLAFTRRDDLKKDASLLPSFILSGSTFFALMFLRDDLLERYIPSQDFWRVIEHPIPSIGFLIFFSSLVFTDSRSLLLVYLGAAGHQKNRFIAEQGAAANP
jgi:hypothetical protein